MDVQPTRDEAEKPEFTLQDFKNLAERAEDGRSMLILVIKDLVLRSHRGFGSRVRTGAERYRFAIRMGAFEDILALLSNTRTTAVLAYRELLALREEEKSEREMFREPTPEIRD